ncbi:MAG: hypothetical protein AAF901_13640 [Bacteroidota bacterium]
MSDAVKVLISNIALPNSGIGSWTTRINRLLQQQPEVFDYILSPSTSLPNALFCNKRKFITWYRPLRGIQLKTWIARDYLKALRKVSKMHTKITVVVMDDPHLLEAIALYKTRLSSKVELIFSFHGFRLTIEEKLLQFVDKILWLSKTAVEESQLSYQVSLPKSIVVGNAVDSNIFFPLQKEAFRKARLDSNYKETDEVLIWMANDRPKKGFHIFESIVKELLKTHKNLRVITLGTTKVIDHPKVKNVGRIPNEQLSKYLQIGNYYIFNLWMINHLCCS